MKILLYLFKKNLFANFFKKKIQNLISDEKFSEVFMGSIWVISARIVATALTLVINIIIVRFYGAHILGILAVINSYLVLATILTVLGTDVSILRLIPEYMTKYSVSSAFHVYKKIQLFVIVFSVGIGVILFFNSDFLAEKIFSKPNLSHYFALASVFIIFKSLMTLNTQAVRGLRLIRTFGFMHVIPHLSNLFILIPLTIFFYYLDNPIYTFLLSIVVTATFGVWIVDRSFIKRKNINDAIHEISMKDILSISLPMLMTATISFIIGQSGVLMLGMFRSETEVGYYSIAVRLARQTTIMLIAINSMAAPKFSELFHSNNINELFRVAKKSTKLIFWSTCPMILFLIFFGKTVISLLFGKEFIIAYGPLFFLVMGQLVNAISGSTSYFMNMTEHQIPLRNIMAAAAFINVILNVILIPYFGILGAGMAAMSSMVFWNIRVLIFIKKKYGMTICYFPIIRN